MNAPAPSPLAVGHAASETGGRTWIQPTPQSGKRAAGVPTVSPVVK